MIRSISSAFEPYQRFYATESEKIERVRAEAGGDRGAVERDLEGPRICAGDRRGMVKDQGGNTASLSQEDVSLETIRKAQRRILSVKVSGRSCPADCHIRYH